MRLSFCPVPTASTELYDTSKNHIIVPDRLPTMVQNLHPSHRTRAATPSEPEMYLYNHKVPYVSPDVENISPFRFQTGVPNSKWDCSYQSIAATSLQHAVPFIRPGSRSSIPN